MIKTKTIETKYEYSDILDDYDYSNYYKLSEDFIPEDIVDPTIYRENRSIAAEIALIPLRLELEKVE